MFKFFRNKKTTKTITITVKITITGVLEAWVPGGNLPEHVQRQAVEDQRTLGPLRGEYVQVRSVHHCKLKGKSKKGDNKKKR